ncbi:MAG: HEAT repeat domain-containing protein [Salinispira sp.]
MKRYRGIFSVIFLFAIALLPAQETLRTLEDLYLSTDIEVQLILSQAVSADRYSKLTALDVIRDMQDGGRIPANENAIMIILSSLSGEGITRTVHSDGRIVNNFPEVRRQAVYLLGEIGGERAPEILYTVFENDPEPMVLSEAILALTKTGISDPQKASKYISNILRSNTLRENPNNGLASACLTAIQDLSVVNATILTEIIDVVSGSYIDKVRQQALNLIDFLRNS